MVILLVMDDPSYQNTQPDHEAGQRGTMGHKRAPYPHIDLSYFISVRGALKIVQFILILIMKVLPRPPYLDFIVELTFILTSLWIWIYVFSLHKRWSIHPTWIDLEFFYTVGATFFYLVMTIITFADASYYLRAAVFGLFTSIAFGAATFALFRDWQEFRQNKITVSAPAAPPAGNLQTNNAGGGGYI